VTDLRSAPAPQLPIELILLRQVASYLDLPVFLIDAGGALVYFNEPAEPLLGLRFDEVGELSTPDWLAAFGPGDEDGMTLASDTVPLVIALREGRAVHARLTIVGLDGVRRAIETTSVPLRGQGGELLGAVALFWPVP
jgi:PAS domain-containing protein